jgi:glutathione peroxidase-family protein
MFKRTPLFVGVIAMIGVAVLGLRASAPQVRDVDGQARDLFKPAGKANVIMFVASDCPVSNGYSPEIQRICSSSGAKGVPCTLVYEDQSIDEAAVRAHRAEYGYRGIAAVIDRDGSIAKRAGAKVTPQAVVIDANGAVKYRGRIDNLYAALGKPRQVATEHDLRDAIDAVLAGRAIAHPETEAFGCFIPPHGHTP